MKFGNRRPVHLLASLFALVALSAALLWAPASNAQNEKSRAEDLIETSTVPDLNEDRSPKPEGISSPITVTATAGTAGPTGYANLKAAFDAINAGTHQGAISIRVVANSIETASAVLNSSGAGTASYTSVLIAPSTTAVSISGPSLQGRGLIELNGADNVTINGDDPDAPGTQANLTIQNTALNTVNFTSVIRIALAATVVTSANNNLISGVTIIGSATGRNISTATSTTGTENTTFGIIASGFASTVSETTEPSPITSVATSVGAGATATNLIISGNIINSVARGITINGGAVSVFPGVQVNSNRIGNQTAGVPDQVYSIGVTAQGSSDGRIGDNRIYVEGFIGSSSATQAINVGVNSANGTFAIEYNRISRVRNLNGASWSAYGINLGGGSNHTVVNNTISGVINDQTAGTGAFGTTFGAYGIRVASGVGHKIYHNSVNLFGPMGGAVSTNLTSAFVVTAASLTGLDVRNNIFANQITGGNPAGTRNVAVTLPAAATVTMNLTLNNNAYFASSDSQSRLAQVGTTFGTGEFQVANFDPTAPSPATNFRSYTSPLSAAGTNDNASFASSSPPPFVSNSDLHIPAGTATRLESGGVNVGVTVDQDSEVRNAIPDIGADEFAGVPPAANDMAVVNFVTPANGALIPLGANFTPQATFTNNGTATQTNVTVRYRIISASTAVVYNQTATIASILPLQSLVVSFPATSLGTAGAYTIEASTELAGDAVPANDLITGSITIVPPLSGSIDVGTAGTFTSLTNAGGLFQALNNAGLSGNLVINLTSDLTGETGAVALNQITETGAGGYTLTIKPSGGPRTISGTSAATSGLIILNGADRVIFDGSTSGGTDRSLTITNNQLTTGVVIWMRSASASNGATNNTVKNCIINGAPGPNSPTVAGILTGSGVTLGNDAEAGNSNNTIQNNWIYRVQNSLYLRGGLIAANFDQNWNVIGNELGSSVVNDKNLFRGMLVGNAQNFVISGNTVHGIQSTTATTSAMSGIQLALLVNGGSVINNLVYDIKNISATGVGSFGFQFSTTSTASNVTVANNFVMDVAATGSATVANNGHGMMFSGSGTGYKVYFNSVKMDTNQATAQTSAAVHVSSTFATAAAIDMRNNIFVNSQTTGTRFAVFSAAAASVFSSIDYNNYFAQNVGSIGATTRVTLADWQAATTQDANSKAVDPLFVSATDLHLQPGSTMIGAGVAGTGITFDFDAQTRDGSPDIGADEIVTGVVPATVSGRIVGQNGRGIANVSVTLVEQNSNIRVARTSSFGYYSFTNLTPAQTITVSPSAKRYTFTPSTFLLNGDTVVNFTANP